MGGNFQDMCDQRLNTLAATLLKSTSLSVNQIPLLISRQKSPQRKITKPSTNEIYENEEDDIVISQKRDKRTATEKLPDIISISDDSSQEKASGSESSAEEETSKEKNKLDEGSNTFGILRESLSQNESRKQDAAAKKTRITETNNDAKSSSSKESDAETIEDSNKEKVAMPDISKSVNNRENNLANEPTTNPRRSLIISNRISEIETSKHNETSRIATAKIDDLIETPKKNIATTDAVPEIETPRIETPKKNNSRIETPQKDNSTTVATPVFSPEEKNVFTQDTTNASESKGQLSSDETIKYLNQLIKLAQQLEEQGQDTGALKSSIVSIRQNLSKDEEEATDEVDSPTIDRSNKRVAPEISTPRTKKNQKNKQDPRSKGSA